MKRTIYTIFFKRLFDIVAATVGLLLCLPVMIVVILLMFATGHRRIFFTQPRVGKHDRVFTLFKLRSMTDARDAQGNLLPDADRLTGFGKFIRRSSLDELPQLINVLKGDMSLIGPRPLLVSYLPLYSAEQRKRHWVQPGITGWAQVNGRNAISWTKKFELDVYYVEHQSFVLDLSILIKTIKNTLGAKDISQAGQATMEAFTGTN
ncbi:MAG TPA: sugar transferase [Ferruginibacter sp.]|nr:sugar transferase [Ferruginibacter sp.]